MTELNFEELYNEIVESQKIEKLTPKAYETLELIANLTLNKFPPVTIDRTDVIFFMMQEAQAKLKYFMPEHTAKPKSALSFFSQVFKNFLKCKNYKNKYTK